MLASDAQNPEFVGAHNPDDRLFVEFYMHDGIDKNRTVIAGKKIRLDPTPYVRIQVPGDKTSVIETPVREDHKKRWPQKWLYFQMQEGLISGESEIPGWKLEEWDYLDPEQVRELKYQRYSIVEQIAGASDAQVQKLGMGGIALREAAKRALRDKMGAEVRDEIARKDREIAELKIAQAEAAKKAQESEDRLKKLEDALLAKQDAVLIPHVQVQPLPEQPATITTATPAPKKRGRPKKNPELAVVEGQVSG